jgi:hypothetical protein
MNAMMAAAALGWLLVSQDALISLALLSRRDEQSKKSRKSVIPTFRLIGLSLLACEPIMRTVLRHSAQLISGKRL